MLWLRQVRHIEYPEMYGSDSLSGVAKIGRRMRLAVLLLVVISFYCSLSNGSDEVICDNGKVWPLLLTWYKLSPQTLPP